MVDNPRMLQCKTSVSTTHAGRRARRHRGLVVIAGGLLALAALATLSGCGQKGPLKLPSGAAPASAPAAS
ncbi:lipoprotein [Piscinibacter sp.]|uniref:LPS translocon maturation chaperone LptM n=2 Tax=Piscinibacter sp. TaxID=1903157 RepID=UPI0025F25CC3|nr:lipoprotein [Piscinibacter sp.]